MLMNKNEDDDRSLYTEKKKCKWLMLKVFLMYVVITQNVQKYSIFADSFQIMIKKADD